MILTNVDLEDKNKITLIEKATHEGNYRRKIYLTFIKDFNLI